MAAPDIDATPAAIRAWTDVLLDRQAFPGDQRAAANALFDALAHWVGIDDSQPNDADLHSTWVDGGWAISPHEAARCLREFMRTAKFMQGVQAAIAAARRRFPGETLQVLYAGTGPFAPLVLPAAHRWPAAAVQYRLLDIHQHSLDAVERVAKQLGVADRIAELICANAVDFRCAADARPHLLITETMQQGLRDETQVAISRNLVPQLRDGGLLVPECIELSAFFGNGGATIATAEPPIDLGPVMRLGKDNAARGGDCFELAWPAGIQENNPPLLRTRIQVHGDIVLGDNECSLNLPMALPLREGPRTSDRLQFSYRLSPKPMLVSHWAGAATDSATPPQAVKPPPDAWLQLPHRFEPAALQAELNALANAAWTQHPNTQDYEGQWRSLALRSPSGATDDARTYSDAAADYQDTEALKASPAMADLLNQLPGQVSSARLLSLSPGARILEHRDVGTSLWDGIARLNVPIQTDERVTFILAGQQLRLRTGECWYLNASYPHAVSNASPRERVHLVADCAVDDRLVEQFLAWGHPPRPEQAFEDSSINFTNLEQVLANLAAMDSAGAAQVAEQLRAQAARGKANESSPA